jgi:membrane-bound lytic murein transglycosylase D
MPKEFFYLAMIESEFKPAARSRVSAVGLWQFMASTARRFGLTGAGHSDDRTNPPKATDAALAYLAQLHDQFGSWYLAAAAYNAGPGTVASALRRVTGRSSGVDADFYRIASALPAETRDYVPKLVAAARVGKASGHL